MDVLLQQPLHSIVQRLAKFTGGAVLIADDETSDPYQMLAFDAEGRCGPVHLDGELLDEFGIVEFKNS